MNSRGNYAKNSFNVGNGRANVGSSKELSTDSRAKFNEQNSLKKVKDVNEDGSERLQKVIARAGFASRRVAEGMITDGKVLVNGKLVKELGAKVNMKRDVVTVNGKTIQLPASKDIFWVVLNKPKSTLTTMYDEKNRQTILDLVPQAKELRLVPVGGMDRDATGLLLLTNDIEWIHPFTHPSYRIKKRYEIVINGIPNLKQIENLELKMNQIYQSDPETKSIKNPTNQIRVMDTDINSKLCLIELITEDITTNRLELLFEEMMGNPNPIVTIKRTDFGSINLAGVQKGKWRELTKKEIENLKMNCKKSEIENPKVLDNRKIIMNRNEKYGKKKFISKPKMNRNADKPILSIKKKYISSDEKSKGTRWIRQPKHITEGKKSINNQEVVPNKDKKVEDKESNKDKEMQSPQNPTTTLPSATPKRIGLGRKLLLKRNSM